MLLIDAHVHIYDCFNLQNFLNSALKNFRAAALHCGQTKDFTAFLFLTETKRENWFQVLSEYALNASTGVTWTFNFTREKFSLWAQNDVGQGLFVIAGRQIATHEGLEVLALITDKQFQEGKPIGETIQTVRDNGALPVIPWGFGKWMGIRGKILKRTIEDSNGLDFFLGDNGGRPLFWPRPSLFKIAESKGIPILPGSDPLPFASESWRPGSLGFLIDAQISREQPAEDLKRVLLDPRTELLAYGSLERPLRFFRNQSRMQLRKRFGQKRAVNS
jgi:hypothetical protein